MTKLKSSRDQERVMINLDCYLVKMAIKLFQSDQEIKSKCKQKILKSQWVTTHIITDSMWKNGPSPSFGAFKKIMLMASRGKCIFHILFGHFIIPAYSVLGLHRCWLRILETKYVGDNFEMLVTVLVDFVTSILYLLA